MMMSNVYLTQDNQWSCCVQQNILKQNLQVLCVDTDLVLDTSRMFTEAGISAYVWKYQYM